MPFFWSDAGWGILIETGAPITADIGASDPAVVRFLVHGEKPRVHRFRGSHAEILSAYSALTGKPGEWPDWAFGVWMSRATYMNAAEMHGVLDELLRQECPVSVMHVDAWMAGNVFRDFTTNWTIDRRRFPSGWTDTLRQRGVRVSLWINPFVLAGSTLGNELQASGMLLRTAAGAPAVTNDRTDRYIVDFTNPAAVAWWQGRIRQLLRDEQPDALKLDFGEEIPLDAVCDDGRKSAEIRNSYAFLYQRATADAIPLGQRPLPLFCRSGCSGSQQYPCHWVGDSPSTWDAMASALRACLALSMSGFALVSHDAGGFSTPGTSGIPTALLDGKDAHFTADVDPELYGRWGQWAACSPVTRFHGLGLREPTAYPEPWRGAVIAALRFRMDRLVPVLRDAHAEAQRSGVPVMRPMALAYPGNAAASAATNQYMLGQDVLVAPVLQPGGRAEVWFPPGEWIPMLGAPVPAAPGVNAFLIAPDAFPIYRRRA